VLGANIIFYAYGRRTNGSAPRKNADGFRPSACGSSLRRRCDNATATLGAAGAWRRLSERAGGGDRRAIDRLLTQENAGKRSRKRQSSRTWASCAGPSRPDRPDTHRGGDPEVPRPAAKERRASVINELSKREQFADRWAVFLGDMFRIRSNADGGPRSWPMSTTRWRRTCLTTCSAAADLGQRQGEHDAGSRLRLETTPTRWRWPA